MEKRNSIPGKYEGFGKAKYSRKKVISLYVPGYDGTKLAVDVILPVDENGETAKEKLPAIVCFSRGGRYGQCQMNGDEIFDHCIPYGYVGVVAEMRGCGVSYGVNNSFASIENRQDTTAILDWIGKQEWSDGQACTFGGSNKGLIQFATAVRKPEPSPVLKGITPVVANADFYYQDYINGVSAIPTSRVHRVSGSAKSTGKKTKEEFLTDKKIKPVDADPNGDQAYEAYEKDQYGHNMPFMKSLLLPNMCRDDENPILGGEKTNLTIPPITDIDVFKKSDVKVHQFAGFLESGPFGQLMAAKEWDGTIVVGPWDHRESRRGNKEFPEGDYNFGAEHLKWFDYLMKGVANGFGERPRFVYYTLNAPEGENWRVSDTWPLENAKPTRLYLTPEKSGTAGSVNDGSLEREKPEQESAQDYQVDTSIRVFDDGEGHTMDRMHLWWDGDMQPGVDNKGLTFTSKPLFGRYRNEITGCTSVDLWVTCSQNDADFLCYLEEVLENGESHYVSMGCLRASHRTSAPREAWNECGATYHPCLRADQERCLAEGMDKPVHLQFHIEPTSYKFKKNSRIRLTVTCADKQTFQHPMYDETNLPQVQLYQGGDHASYIEVPFVESEENVYNGKLEKGEYRGPATCYFFKEHTYLYYNGTWEKYHTEELAWNLEDGVAVFEQGFRFIWEGRAQVNGILQDYQGTEKPIAPFPVKRHQVVDVMPVSVDKNRLFMPGYKSIYVEAFAKNWKAGAEKRPAILYMHGYSKTPSELQPLQLRMLEEGYVVIGIDMRNYPPNIFPDYLHDEKGCVRYLRAHAEAFGIDPERIGCCGQSLGGNGLLLLSATGGCDAKLEGSVGGNLEYSSRVQASVIGYGWCDLLTMGEDLIEENANQPEAVKKIKWDNSNGPMAPAGAVIGFTGKGKGLQVLVDYARAKASGDVSGFEHPEELERMLKIAESASPISYIGPDTPPMALFSGINDVSIDIANRQSLRTFEKMGEYGVDGFLFANTNGRYGKRPEIIAGVLEFLHQNLDRLGEGNTLSKVVAKPRETCVLEDGTERENVSAPILRQGEEILVCADYAKEKFGAQIEPGEGDVWIDGKAYKRIGELTGSKIAVRYFADRDMAVILPEDRMPAQMPRVRS